MISSEPGSGPVRIALLNEARRLPQLVPSGVLLVGADLRVLFGSQEARALLDLRRDDVEGRPLEQVFPIDGVRELALDVLSGGSSRSVLFAVTAQGMRTYRASIVGIQRSEKKPREALVTFEEIQNARDGDATLHERLFDTFLDGIILAEARLGVISEVNAAAAALLDRARGDLIGKSIWDIPPFRKLGSRKSIAGRLESGDRLRYEGPAGARVLEVEAVLWRDSDGGQIQSVIRDVAARKRMDARTEHQRKLAGLRDFAAAAARETALVVCSAKAARKLARRSTPEIDRGIYRGIAVNAGLRAFSGVQSVKLAQVDLNQLIRQGERMMRRILKGRVALTVALDPDAGTIEAEAPAIRGILKKLARHAYRSMPQGGALTVETGNLDLTPDETHDIAIDPGSYVVLAVSDTAPQQEPANLPRLFEPFAGAQPDAGDPGLDLPAVFGMVKKMGGFIGGQLQPDKGTTLLIYFRPASSTSGS